MSKIHDLSIEERKALELALQAIRKIRYKYKEANAGTVAGAILRDYQESDKTIRAMLGMQD